MVEETPEEDTTTTTTTTEPTYDETTPSGGEDVYKRQVEEVAAVADVPVVNALTDGFHPCQILADLLTISEHLGDPRGLTMAYVGDGNNMANSYLEAGALTGCLLYTSSRRVERGFRAGRSRNGRRRRPSPHRPCRAAAGFGRGASACRRP